MCIKPDKNHVKISKNKEENDIEKQQCDDENDAFIFSHNSYFLEMCFSKYDMFST